MANRRRSGYAPWDFLALRTILSRFFAAGDATLASLVRSIATVGSNTLLSRVLGFVRDMVMARVFGADAGTDAFLVAFKIPNFLRRLFAEGAFSLAFVPVLTEYCTLRPYVELKRFVDDVAGTLATVLLLVTGLGILGAPVLISLFAPGFLNRPLQFGLAVEMLRLTFPYLFFISLTAFAGGILNAHRRFGVPAFTPVLLNLAMIAAALWLTPYISTPILALAWGVLIAGVVQLGFQVPFLRQLKLLPRPRLAWRDPGVRRIGRLILPALFGVSVSQLNLLLDTLIASFLVGGSISWLYYSDRLMEFPLGILGVALGTVILPNLSRNHAEQSHEQFSRTIDWALRWVLLLGLPSAVGMLVLAGPMFAALFYSKAFTAEDVLKASQSLQAYSFGLLGFMSIKVLAPGFYSRQDTRTPVRIGVITMIVNMALNLALMFPLGHVGLALSTTLSASLNAGLLYRQLRLQGVYRPQPGWGRLLRQGVLAALLMGVVLSLGGVGDLSVWLAWSTTERVVRLVLWVLVGVTVYGLALLALGVRPRHLTSRDL